MHSLCSGHSAPVISGVSVASNPPRRKADGNQGSSTLAAFSPPASRSQCVLRAMAACAYCAHAFDRSSNGRCALATSATAWRGVIPALRDAGSGMEMASSSGTSSIRHAIERLWACNVRAAHTHCPHGRSPHACFRHCETNLVHIAERGQVLYPSHLRRRSCFDRR